MVVLAIGGVLGYVYFDKQANTAQSNASQSVKTFEVESVKVDLSKIKIDENARY